MTRRVLRSIAVLAMLQYVNATSFAQQSASFRIRESHINEGGNPIGGVTLASASYRVRLDAVGDSVARAGLAAASYKLDAGFVAGYPPPGEALALRFTGPQELSWDAERSVGAYDVYRDAMTALAGGATGACFQPDVSAENSSDASIPLNGEGFFYLVTARNRLGEEGTKGFRSGGVERPNPAPCP
jgi:hypothetical protein